MCGRSMNLRVLPLPTENVEQNSGSKRMAYQADLAIELWVTLSEEVVNTIGFCENDVADVFSICALVEEDVQS